MSDSTRPRASVAERWSLPTVEGPIIGMRRESPVRERERAEQAARASNAVHEAEKTRGYDAGVAAGRAELKGQLDAANARVARLDEILNRLCQPLVELESEVEEQLVLLALAIGKQLARRELKTDPGQITALIREAVGRLPAAAREIRVYLHPQDATAIKERLATAGQERAWTVVEDPTLARGGCLVRSENSQIDARLESRVNAMVSSMLGEERASARLGSADSEAAIHDDQEHAGEAPAAGADSESGES